MADPMAIIHITDGTLATSYTAVTDQVFPETTTIDAGFAYYDCLIIMIVMIGLVSLSWVARDDHCGNHCHNEL